jgi:tetratricopeptide (TPR) repeat protein
LGQTLQAQRRFEEAASHYQKAARLKPDFTMTHLNLAAVFVHLGRIEDAFTQYQEALRIDPNFAEAHHNWGLVLLLLGKPVNAADHFQQALRIKPGLRASREGLHRAQALIQQKGKPK